MWGFRGKRLGKNTRIYLERLGLSLINTGLTLSLAGVVMLVGGLVVLITIRELRTPALVLIFLALLLLAIPLVTSFPSVRKAVTARTGRYTANTLVMVLAFLAITVLAGFVSFENSYRLDVTATKQFSLAPQTKKILKELDEPVKVTGYFSPTDPRQEIVRQQADDFLHEFNRRSRKFTFEFVDPDLKPSQPRQDGVTDYPTIVFKAPESQRRPFLLTPIFFGESLVLSEQDLVAALLIITGTEQKTVYFTTGHGERNTQDLDEGSEGFGIARGGLVRENYRVGTLNLLQVEAIPQDAAVLVIAGAARDFRVDEMDKIQEYLRNGGRALFLMEPNSSNLNILLNKWGVSILEGTIVDLINSVTGDPRSPILRRSQYNPDEPITKPLDDTFFTGAASIRDIIERAPPGLLPNPDEINISLSPLALTSSFSCVTNNPDLSNCSEDEIISPQTIAMVVVALAPVGEDRFPSNPIEELNPTSIVIIGDSDFASNKFFYAFNNGDLFLNSVDWLAQKYDLISVHAKPRAFRQLIITQREFDFIRYSSWFLLPTGVLLLAGVAWWRRR